MSSGDSENKIVTKQCLSGRLFHVAAAAPETNFLRRKSADTEAHLADQCDVGTMKTGRHSLELYCAARPCRHSYTRTQLIHDVS